MKLALIEAKKAIPTLTAFCVGCVIVDPTTSSVISTGYSRELSGNTHAEANAIDKLKGSKPINLVGSDLYTTLEPCSIRTSGNIPCSRRIIENKFGRVFIGVEEPTDFVLCEGIKLLRDAGIEVWIVEGLNEECIQEARKGH
jgi:pyrimidine deaminase RibD-like protein